MWFLSLHLCVEPRDFHSARFWIRVWGSVVTSKISRSLELKISTCRGIDIMISGMYIYIYILVKGIWSLLGRARICKLEEELLYSLTVVIVGEQPKGLVAEGSRHMGHSEN